MSNKAPGSADCIEAKASPVSQTDATQFASPASSPASSPIKSELIRLQLIPWSIVPMIKPILNELVERRVREGQTFKIGRQVTKEIQPGQPIPAIEPHNPLDVWFLSKVVSRCHAEFSIKDGLIYIRDTGSSSGTFLNKARLSPTTKESKAFSVKEGDIIQFGVDYKGRPDDVYKSVTIRIGFYDQSWVHAQRKKADPTKFRTALISLLNSTNTSPDNQREEKELPECCICYEETGPFQALFLAPCSHCYHYKCVSAIIVQSAMFQCPLCRQVANLTASVSTENLHSAIDETEVAIGAKGDAKKFLQSAAAIEAANAAAALSLAQSLAAKSKKRRNSFTSRISTIFRKASAGPQSASSTSAPPVPLLPLHGSSGSGINVPNLSSPLRLRSIEDEAPRTPIGEQGTQEVEGEEAEEAEQEDASNFVAIAVAPTTTISLIPRSTTVNTFDGGEDLITSGLAHGLNIPNTIQESMRDLRVE